MAKKKRSRSVQQSANLGCEAPSNLYHQSRRTPEVVSVPMQSTPVVLPGRQVPQVSGAGPCFYCGEFGHFRRKVPGGAAAASKQYPLECDTYSDDCDLYDLLSVDKLDCEGQGPGNGPEDPLWELDIDEVHGLQVQGDFKEHIRF